MKRYIKNTIVFFCYIAVCIFITSCTPIVENYDKSSQSNVQKNLAEEAKNNNENKLSKVIYDDDFIVTGGKNTIVLDTLYKDFTINKKEIELEDNYVGDVSSGDYVYKYYIHKFEDFEMYVSNANYDKKNRDFNEYYISQITLINSNFKTARGISLGSSYDDVIRLYGEGIKQYEESGKFIIYQLNDKALSFEIDENQKIKDITLRVIVE
ncbi:MAG: hypothetical protein N4A62_03105 [Marinisporobacter sp.]|jgi:hypothetical protein|nr:hypothetical protein [Marinisporobacter sp.]